MHAMIAPARRLHDQLPLLGRQRQLPTGYAEVHRTILWSFAERGVPPEPASFGGGVLERLAADDLIVTAPSGAILGAYPFTVEDTPHRLVVGGVAVGAMCSLDAVSVAPVFGLEVTPTSTCAATDRPIRIHQRPDGVVSADPSQVRVGVRWQAPDRCAAHSMCRDMVFLADAHTAHDWASDMDADTFTLVEAVAFGTSFFAPLLGEDAGGATRAAPHTGPGRRD